MSRINIYNLLEQKAINPSDEYARIHYLLSNTYFDQPMLVTLYTHIREDVFDRLPIKRTCVHLNDLLNELGIDLKRKNATMDDLFDLIEFILCVIDSEPYAWCKDRYAPIINNINIVLDKTSHKIVQYKKGKIIVPKDSTIEEAAVLAKNKNLSLEILAYNHRSNNGNLQNKADILNLIAKQYEDDIAKDKSQLGDDIRFLLNNFNIRHNNEDSEKNNTEFMNRVDKNLELWYDRLYCLFISFIITSQQKEISSEIKKLKKGK